MNLASISTAAERFRKEFGRLDVLVQNAAITKTSDDAQTPEEYVRAHRPSIASLDEIRAVWDTNVFGVLAVYQAMVPILHDTPNSRIVNVSSAAGSLTLASDPNSPMRSNFDATYAASKTALNGLTLAMAIELEADGINVNAVSPGYTKTKMNPGGTDTVEEGAAEAVRHRRFATATPDRIRQLGATVVSMCRISFVGAVGYYASPANLSDGSTKVRRRLAFSASFKSSRHWII
ncbi:MAG: SDR family NAD(P)-dependent oxidoreductase [Rhizomicrobium sp.]